MVEADDYPNKSHFHFPYWFTDNDESSIDGSNYRGIDFNSYWQKYDGDLLILLHDDLDVTATEYISCWCSRWDVDNYSIVLETWLKKDELQLLLENIRPGAVGELYKILGRPHFVDKSWTKNNTIRVVPNKYKTYERAEGTWAGNNASNIPMMRNEILLYPKTITAHPIGNSDWIEVKIESAPSGSAGL